jgi:ribosomal subunit interface protein
VDIVVKGRQVDLSDRFREHVGERLEKVERFDPKIQRVDVEVSKELNPRLADRALRVQLTIRSRGPVVRAEAAADDKYAALDVACNRLEARLRKAADRRHDHHKRLDGISPDAARGAAARRQRPGESADDEARDEQEPLPTWAEYEADDGEGPMVVREKVHDAIPMTLDQALEAMELVGHDFYLFLDAPTSRPAVVYRRRGYHYGVIHLDLDGARATG